MISCKEEIKADAIKCMHCRQCLDLVARFTFTNPEFEDSTLSLFTPLKHVRSSNHETIEAVD